jgi:hypothetical protein
MIPGEHKTKTFLVKQEMRATCYINHQDQVIIILLSQKYL